MRGPDFSKMHYDELEAWRTHVTYHFTEWEHFARFLRILCDAAESRVITPEQARLLLDAYPSPADFKRD